MYGTYVNNISAMRCPFSIHFASDNYEIAAMGDETGTSTRQWRKIFLNVNMTDYPNQSFVYVPIKFFWTLIELFISHKTHNPCEYR